MSFPSQQRIRFGVFEVDARSGELLRHGVKVDLQEQPFQALVALLERPGEVITREELSRRLWPENTFVDFDRGLNKAINKLRAALKDNAEKPRFIETLPQRGYRFVAPVETADIPDAPAPKEQTFEAPVSDRLDEGELIPPAFPSYRDQSTWRNLLPWAVALSIALLAVVGFGTQIRAPAGAIEKPFLRFDLDVGTEEFTQPAISPDGLRLVFISKGALMLRRLDQSKTTRLAGTEGAFFPFFSPDGRWVAFFAAGSLQKVAIEGGAPVILCHAGSPGGGSWADNNYIVAALDANNEGLSRIPVAGGSPQLLTDSKADPSGPLMHLWPQALPGGKAVLFAAVNGSAHGSLRVLTLGDGKIQTVVENSTRGRYLHSGYLLFCSQSELNAAPIDPARWKVTGPAVPLVSGLANAGGFGQGEFDVSSSGTVVYRTGAAGSSFVVSWLSPSGKTEPVLAKPDSFLTPRLSPDGKRLAVAMVENERQSLWIYDLERDTWARVTTDSGPELLPTWTPDGEYLAFRSGNSLAWTRSDGSGSVGRLAGSKPNMGPWSFSSDGKWLSIWPLEPDSGLWNVPVDRTQGTLHLGAPKALPRHAGSEGAPAISPDSRWLAYTSSESGRFEIYVVPFSPQGLEKKGKWLISSGGGVAPVWSHSRSELFYQGADRRVHVARYRAQGDSFLAEKARVWSGTLLGETGIFNAFDLAPDGNRVIALLAAEEPRANNLAHFLLNVDSELRRTVPARPN